MKDNMVKALGRGLDVSPKQAIEICTYVRGRSLKQAKHLLQLSIDMLRPVPLTRFTNGPGHKPGIAAGRFYPKTCSEVLKILESAEANAKNKGLSVADLKVTHIAAQRGSMSWHYGRKRRSRVLTTHIEVVLEEVKGATSKKPAKIPKSTSKPVLKSTESKSVKKESAKEQQ